jgi:all-trans-retinol 13,14-reductase
MSKNINEINEKFDLIFIGSGMGTLTTASLLAQFFNKKILVLEKHFQPGGYTHEFQRKQGKFHWDVGIHYVGDMQEGGLCRILMDKVTRQKVKWQKMAEPFEKFVYPQRTFALYGEEERFCSDLIAQFPEEKESIEKYFKDIKKLSAVFGKSIMMKSSSPNLKSFTSSLDTPNILTVKDYMDAHFKDPELKAILASQWGDYGLPPAKSAMATHATLVNHYLKGGYYPVGGAGKIFEAVEPILEEKGGVVLSSTEVSEILFDGNKAIGVKARYLRGEKTERSFFAPVIVSCAGAYPTFTKLVPDNIEVPFRGKLKDFYSRERMATSICLYMGLSEDPRKLGFQGENYWIFSSVDHDANFEKRNDWLYSESEIPNIYFSFPSLKDPDAKHHTADAITFVDYSEFSKWKDGPWKKRGEEYSQFKEKIAQRILNFLEQKFPGFSKMVEYYEVSTPITNEHFTSHPDGAIYGLACVPERYEKENCPWFESKTIFPGLFLTGADAGGSPGIAGAMMGGLATATAILGNRDILKEVLKG